MLKLILLITPRIDAAHEIGEAWQKAGAPGITFIESHGLHRLQEASKSYSILPGMLSMMEIMRQQEENNVIILSVAPQQIINTLIEETGKIVGDIRQPDNGVLFILDVEQALGVRGITDSGERD